MTYRRAASRRAAASIGDPSFGAIVSEEIRVSVPARPEFVHLLRSVVSSVAARLNFTYESIDDLRIAVDEASAQLLRTPKRPTTLTMRILPVEGRLEVALSADALSGAWPPDGTDHGFTRQILDALVDEMAYQRSDDVATVTMIKHGAPSPSEP